MCNSQYPTIDILKKHYPNLIPVFDQILQTKESENGYKEKYKKELERKKEVQDA